jgi:hypothetical protein
LHGDDPDVGVPAVPISAVSAPEPILEPGEQTLGSPCAALISAAGHVGSNAVFIRPPSKAIE